LNGFQIQRGKNSTGQADKPGVAFNTLCRGERMLITGDLTADKRRHTQTRRRPFDGLRAMAGQAGLQDRPDQGSKSDREGIVSKTSPSILLRAMSQVEWQACFSLNMPPLRSDSRSPFRDDFELYNNQSPKSPPNNI
jgi:hypothetical protein